MSARRAGLAIAALALGLGLLSLLVWLVGRPRQAPPLRPTPAAPAEPSFRLDLGGRTVRGYLADGTLLFETSVAGAEYWEESQVATLTGVECRLFRQGRVAAEVVAQRLEARFREKELHFSGEVRADSRLGPAKVTAPALLWLYDQDRLVCDQPVSLTVGGITVQGARFEADTALLRGRLYGGASFSVVGAARAGRGKRRGRGML